MYVYLRLLHHYQIYTSLSNLYKRLKRQGDRYERSIERSFDHEAETCRDTESERGNRDQRESLFRERYI